MTLNNFFLSCAVSYSPYTGDSRFLSFVLITAELQTRKLNWLLGSPTYTFHQHQSQVYTCLNSPDRIHDLFFLGSPSCGRFYP